MNGLSTPDATDVAAGHDGPTGIRVGILNDFELLIAGLASALDRYGPAFEFIPLAVDATEVHQQVDVVLLDTFAFNDGLAQRIGSLRTRVVVFSNATDPDVIIGCLRAGAAGFVYKGVSVTDLVQALQDVARSTTPVIILAPRRPGDPAPRSWPGLEEALNEREAEVLALICRGLSNREIATLLHVKTSSIKSYIGNVYRKVGLQSRAEAVIWGYQHGFGKIVPRRHD